mmetsp:Transcript_11536/g.26631  ORF Transcript_11536/g.26631 Transcript_11536/m.26631 type:complete len:295 (-) Transcript_11536:173-1057(-)
MMIWYRFVIGTPSKSPVRSFSQEPSKSRPATAIRRTAAAGQPAVSTCTSDAAPSHAAAWCTGWIGTARGKRCTSEPSRWTRCTVLPPPARMARRSNVVHCAGPLRPATKGAMLTLVGELTKTAKLRESAMSCGAKATPARVARTAAGGGPAAGTQCRQTSMAGGPKRRCRQVQKVVPSASPRGCAEHASHSSPACSSARSSCAMPVVAGSAPCRSLTTSRPPRELGPAQLRSSMWSAYGGPASHSASSSPPKQATLVLAGDLRRMSAALAAAPPARCVPNVVRYTIAPAPSSCR